MEYFWIPLRYSLKSENKQINYFVLKKSSTSFLQFIFVHKLKLIEIEAYLFNQLKLTTRQWFLFQNLQNI